MKNIPKLLKQYQNDQMRLKLLSISDTEKRSVMKKTLNSDQPVPDDKEFIEAIFNKAEQALREQYLEKKDGKYCNGHPTAELQYDYIRDDAKVTIPESMGRIKLLIDNFSVPLKEKKELLVTLANQNPELVEKKLSKIRLELGDNNISQRQVTNRAKFYELLDNIDANKVNKLFKEISNLDIKEIWKEQKEFVFLKQIYIAATTYGENTSACIQGTWSQIINSISEISSKIVVQYDRHLEEEQKQETQKNVITKENIKLFMEGLANKLIQHVELHPELKETLEDFVVCIVDIDKPEEVTFEQQKILAEINKYFSENIKDALRNYNRNIPNRDEYGLIIEGLSEVEVMKRFVQEEDDQPQISTQSNIKDLNQPVKKSQNIYGKIGIGCSMVIGIAGIALGVAIAVHLEMLAVGIAVGVCCLAAAAIIYYCSKPSKSLEGSSVQELEPQLLGV
ncbi:TomO hydrophobic C-terminal domain-containing protein [Candidatus Wolbachia massiliensis]|uniref:Uncharacterized protein n=1 Tax=Candidatus Wolbachia massiliensis TaxID=1845000 RepID=A0A7L7YLV6_9RICK|nr:hypothetical protein [Candidatus Wolbachia massiliensis]QOD38232.1 hypothetical protein ID128_05625 [Candidatus Wolbachia massiliensis]